MLNRKQLLAGLSALGTTAALAGASRPAAADGEHRAEIRPDIADTHTTTDRKPSVLKVTAETATFVESARYEDLPPELIALGKQHILDAFGLAIAGEKAETGPILRRYLADLGVLNGPSSVLGTNLHAPPRFAAFANGVAIHADDFDDTQLAVAKDRVYGLLTHPTVPTLPPALALSEALNKSGRDFMLAYHLGVEVATKLAEAIAPRSYEGGFHATSMCGVFGSAAAAGKLRGLDAKQLRNAFGVAGAEAGGLRENFGTMTKPFQAGHAAEAGIVAVDLAALGWTAAEDIFEAKRGFFAAFGGGWDPGAIVGRLGRPWSLLSPGVSIKPYPSGSLTHPAMDVMAELIAQHGIRPQEVAQVRVGTNRQMLNTLIHHRPRTGLQAKFSMEYCMAVLLVLGKAGLGQFQDAAVDQPELQAMVAKVDFYNNPDADAAGADKMRSYVEVQLTDGRSVSGQGDFARGSPEKPMSFDDTVAKFEGCADFAGLPRDRAGRIVSAVRNLDTVPNMRFVLTGLFA